MLREIKQLIGGFVFVSVTFFVMLQTSVAQERIHVSGYGNTHYMDHSGTPNFKGEDSLNNGFFQIREFSLFVDFTLTDMIIASTEIEAGENGDEYTANYAYLSIQVADTLNIRVGKILVPFLSYNENKPNFNQFLMSQPFTAFNIVPVIGTPILNHGFGWSDAGAVIDLCCLGNEGGILNLKLGIINGLGSSTAILDDNTVTLVSGPTIRPRDGLLQNEATTQLRDNNNNKAVIAKLTFKAMTFPFDIGFSWYQGKWDDASSKNLEMSGGHLNWLDENWSLKGEYVTAKVEQDAGFDPLGGNIAPDPVGPTKINTTTGDYEMMAWYAELSYVVVRYSGEKYLRLITRYDDVDTNNKASFTPWDRSRITGGMEFQFAPNARVRYEWQRSKIHDFQRAPLLYIKAGGKEKINMNMVSVIFSF